jgi:uncharacterized cupin superfamily protein
MSVRNKRPDFIRHWRDIETPAAPPGAAEDFGFASELADAAGLGNIRVAQLRIPPGVRAYPPLALRDLEVFAFVLEGEPDLWLDGHLHRLQAGDGICLNAGTGIAHSLINNAQGDARVLTFSLAMRRSEKVAQPTNPAAQEQLAKMGMHWADAPKRKLGPNSGKPGDLSGRKRARPDCIVHWREILSPKANRYKGSDEDQGLNARFGRHARFSRIGAHVELLKPGRRTSYPHAERDEDEFVHVISGRLDAWNDGHIIPLAEGDFVGWRAGTGITHVIINNSDEDAVMLVGGEASRQRAQIWYPLHPHRDKETGEAFWADHPKPKLGPHDGMPDALRARVPAAKRKNPVVANAAARFLGKRKKK